MTARKKNPLPRSVIASMGGKAVARDRAHMSRIGAAGAAANLAKNGTDQPQRAALIRHGYEIASVAPSARGDGP